MRDVWTSPLPNGVQVSLRRNTSFLPFVGAKCSYYLFSKWKNCIPIWGSMTWGVSIWIHIIKWSPNEYSIFFIWRKDNNYTLHLTKGRSLAFLMIPGRRLAKLTCKLLLFSKFLFWFSYDLHRFEPSFKIRNKWFN